MRTPLQKGEKILLVTFTSWVSLIGPSLFALAAIVGSYFIGFIDHYGWILAVVGVLVIVSRYLLWKVNIWVVTNFRVIDEAGYFTHYAKESPLEKINNVSYDQTVWGRVFNYGHVEIQTAAELGATDYFNVNHPKRLKDTITQAQADFNNAKAINQASLMATALGVNKGQGSGGGVNVGSELEKLFDLRQKGILTEEEYNKAKNKLLNS